MQALSRLPKFRPKTNYVYINNSEVINETKEGTQEIKAGCSGNKKQAVKNRDEPD